MSLLILLRPAAADDTPVADPSPATFTIYDSGHTTTIRDTGHTATLREQRN